MKKIPASVCLQTAFKNEWERQRRDKFCRAEMRKGSLCVCNTGRDESKTTQKHLSAKEITVVGFAGLAETSCKPGISVIGIDQALNTFISCMC